MMTAGPQVLCLATWGVCGLQKGYTGQGLSQLQKVPYHTYISQVGLLCCTLPLNIYNMHTIWRLTPSSKYVNQKTMQGNTSDSHCDKDIKAGLYLVDKKTKNGVAKSSLGDLGVLYATENNKEPRQECTALG